jgi:hypothetical protein
MMNKIAPIFYRYCRLFENPRCCYKFSIVSAIDYSHLLLSVLLDPSYKRS